MIGTILGSRYELLEKIGEGGMAIVYKAKCHLLNRYVAVKILKEEYSNNVDFMDKFKREAASVASLSSNNIVNIYDVGSERDVNYIVMEYIKGKTLKEIIIENGSIKYDKVIDYGMQIAKALECAHKNNIIHRDIKPHNILITEDGTVKVTDFGIAKASSSVTITNTSTVMGSAHYFSPEQAKASFVDCRTDIYSFGIVLYEMTTGRVPFDAESPVSVALKHIQEPVIPPREINGNIPMNLNKLILKAIEKEPIKRYQTAKEMFLDLQSIQNNSAYSIATSSMENGYTRIMEPVNVAEHESKLPQNVEGGKKNKTAIIISVAIILMLILGSGLGYIWAKGGGKKIPVVTGQIFVPKIKGLDKKEAKDLVTKLGLTFSVADEVNSDLPKDTVTTSFPEEGTEIKPNQEVRVYISKGLEAFTAPNVTEVDKNQAIVYIESNGLKVGAVKEEFNDTVLAGIIISQSPVGNSPVKKGDTINLVVSKGPEIKLTKVPDLIGLSLGDAQRFLENKNLKLGGKKVIVTNEKIQDGKIVNQDIAKDIEVKEGSSVGVSYYKYEEPAKEQYTVPDFIGKTVAEARALAHTEDVTIIVSGEDKDIIDSQDKKAKTKADVGEPIKLTSKPVPPAPPAGTP